MTKEKFTQVFYEEAEVIYSKIGKFVENDTVRNPENWEAYRDSVIVFIKEIDKAYEVYQMENTVK